MVLNHIKEIRQGEIEMEMKRIVPHTIVLGKS